MEKPRHFNGPWIIRALISAPHLSIALGFGFCTLLEPESGLKVAFYLLRFVMPIQAWGALFVSCALVGLCALRRGKYRQWVFASRALVALFAFLSGTCLFGRSPTGGLTYGLICAYSFLHATDLWLPIGIVTTTQNSAD